MLHVPKNVRPQAPANQHPFVGRNKYMFKILYICVCCFIYIYYHHHYYYYL